MTPIDAIAAQLQKEWGGETLSSLCAEAKLQLNGTAYHALRPAPGLRAVLLFCITGKHELKKLGKIPASGALGFEDWSRVSLFEAVTRTIQLGGFVHDFDRREAQGNTPVVLIAADPKSVATLEKMFGLQP